MDNAIAREKIEDSNIFCLLSPPETSIIIL